MLCGKTLRTQSERDAKSESEEFNIWDLLEDPAINDVIGSYTELSRFGSREQVRARQILLVDLL